MDHSITILSEKEKAILESYMLSADGLAEFWGENCEVIIHDLTQLDASVVKIVNGHLSGRQVGAPISESPTLPKTNAAKPLKRLFPPFLGRSTRLSGCSASIII